MTSEPIGQPGEQRSDPCERVVVKGADGATLTACAYGGHVLGWTCAGSDDPRLWLSPLARCGDGAAIRGGVPVIFPQFAARGALPKHGLARDRAWTLDAAHPDDDGAACFVAHLSDDEATRAIWPYRFTLTLTAVAAGQTLRLALAVRNDDDRPVTFTAALHSYLALTAAGGATIEGLSGVAATDNARDGAPMTLDDAPLPALEPRDIAVPSHRGDVVLVDRPRALWLTRDGFDDLVVWNPGPDHGLGDVPADGPQGSAGFVCVEPAQLTPVTLEPQEEWTGLTQLTAGSL